MKQSVGMKFWHSDKRNSTPESTPFEEFDQCCWQQDMHGHFQAQSQASDNLINHSMVSGETCTLNKEAVHHIGEHMYTITVLNARNESAMQTDFAWSNNSVEATQLAGELNFSSLLNNFCSDTTSERSFGKSMFDKDDLCKIIENCDADLTTSQSTLGDPSDCETLTDFKVNGVDILLPTATNVSNGTQNVSSADTLLSEFDKNNNFWETIDHKSAFDISESLLKSALQGKSSYEISSHAKNSNAFLLNASVSYKNQMSGSTIGNQEDFFGFADITQKSSHKFQNSEQYSNLYQLPDKKEEVNYAFDQKLCQANQSVRSSNLMDDEMCRKLGSTFCDDINTLQYNQTYISQCFNSSAMDLNNSHVAMQIVPTDTNPSTLNSHLQSIPAKTKTKSNIFNTLFASTSPKQVKLIPLTQQQKPQNMLIAAGRIRPTPQLLCPKNSTAKWKIGLPIAANNNNQTATDKSISDSSNSNCDSNLKSDATKNSSLNNKNETVLPSNETSAVNKCSVIAKSHRKERLLHNCTICSKTFKDKYSVNVHIRTHTGEKPFACSLCGKSFRQKAHLAKHYQTHIAQNNKNIVEENVKRNSSKQYSRLLQTRIQ